MKLTFLLILIVLLAACQTATPDATNAPLPAETDDSYPAPEVTTPEPAAGEPYPAATEPTSLDPNVTPGYPAPGGQGDSVEWEEATRLILDGQVAQVTQNEDLIVILVLKDGRTISTREPATDEVLNLIDQCGDLCKDIVVSTD